MTCHTITPPGADLPLWVTQSHQALPLIQAILEERPDYWALHRYGDVPYRYPKYHGKNALALRKLWEAKVDAAVEANDRPTFTMLNQNHPDDLIHRLLNRLDEQPYVELKRTGTGGWL